jgi:hypothetical protein
MSHPAHAHLRAYLSTVGRLPGGELQDHGGTLSCRTTIPWPMFNGALCCACGSAGERQLRHEGERDRPGLRPPS